MKQMEKPTKKLIIKRYKVKIQNNPERLKTESQKNLNKNIDKSLIKEKNEINNYSLYNIGSYQELNTEDKRMTLRPKKENQKSINDTSDTPLRKTLFLKNRERERVNSVKTNTKNKEKKTVNFAQKPNLKQQKSERNLKKENKEEYEKKLKLNKSVGHLKKDIFNDNITDLKEEKEMEIIEIKTNVIQLKKEEELNNEDILQNFHENNNNSQINKKVTFKENIYQEKGVNKEQKKKGNKAYLNFVQNIKNTNKKKKDNKISNILKYEEPKNKLQSAFKKVNILNKTIKGINKNKNKDIDFRKTINNPLISNLREEILNTKEETYNEPKNNSSKNILKESNINANNNIEKFSDNNYENYTGLILLKLEEGKKLLEMKLDETIENINDKLNKEKIEINNKQIEIIYKYELEKIKEENEKINQEYLKLKEEYEKQKEMLIFLENDKKLKEENLLIAMKKKSKEEEAIQNEQDNYKIKEIKERIQKYKDELKNGNSTFENLRKERMSCRVRFNKKDSLNLDQKMKEIEKNKKEEENKIKQNDIKEINNNVNIQKTVEIKKDVEIKNEMNKNELNKNINNNKEKNNINVANKEKNEKKDNKDKNKGYSKALDRFKKRFKKDNSMEVRTKKSEKINEIARQLENMIGRQQSQEFRDASNISNEIIHNQNSSEIIENQIICNSSRTRKPQRPQF